MGGKIERKVERRDEAARANWHTLPDTLIAACARGNVKRLDFAGHPNTFLGRDPKRVNQPTDFTFAVFDWLARFDAQCIGQFIRPRLKPVDAVLEDGLPFIRRHSRHWLGSVYRCGNSGVDRCGIRLRDAERDLAGKFVGDSKVCVQLFSFISKIERINVLEHHTAFDNSLISRFKIRSLSV